MNEEKRLNEVSEKLNEIYSLLNYLDEIISTMGMLCIISIMILNYIIEDIVLRFAWITSMVICVIFSMFLLRIIDKEKEKIKKKYFKIIGGR